MTSVCTQELLCRSMRDFIEHDEEKPGFHIWKKVEGGKLVTKGVMYKARGRKRHIILNRCPWCEAEIKWGITP